MENPLISLANVSLEIELPHQKIELLKQLQLNIKRGGTYAIMGRSGSGKSSLLGLMAGLQLPTKGDVCFLGQSWSSLSVNQRATWRGKHSGFVFQDFQLIDSMTALENVLFPMDIQGIQGAEIKAKALLEELGLGERMSHRPHMMSGGEQQRVAIARAFATDPVCVFLDEPTGQLDEATGEKLLNVLFSFQKRHQATFIFVTHDAVLAARCDHRYLLKEGQLHEQK